jgi:hypothetical protein
VITILKDIKYMSKPIKRASNNGEYIKKILKTYSKPGEKACEGKCDREQILNMLVCHGCKRIIIKF